MESIENGKIRYMKEKTNNLDSIDIRFIQCFYAVEQLFS